MEDSFRITDLEAKVGALERKLDYVMRNLELTYSEDALSSALEQAADLLRNHDEIAAIKVYREATGAGLKESKDAVEALKQTLPGT